MNHAYFDLFKVRQNTPNISVRYLETRHSVEETDKLLQLYPEFKIERDIIENIILDISNNIYKKYRSRYIFKNTTFLPPCQYKILIEIVLFRKSSVSFIFFFEIIFKVGKLTIHLSSFFFIILVVIALKIYLIGL